MTSRQFGPGRPRDVEVKSDPVASGVLGALLAAALLLPAVVRSPYVLHVAVLAGIYVILTLSLNLVTGFCGQFSLGHAGFYGIGAYTAALLAVTWGSPFVLNLVAAAAAAGAAGFLIGLPTLRLGGIYLAMATLGFGEIIHLDPPELARGHPRARSASPPSPAPRSSGSTSRRRPASTTSCWRSSCSRRWWSRGS